MTDRAHLAFVRAQGCVVRPTPADRCFGPIEAHHVRSAANSGMGMKPPDTAAVGLCCRHHRALHTMGRRTFETLHAVDLAAQAARLAAEDAAPDAPKQEETPAMLDTAQAADPTLDYLRERAAELELIGRENATRLDELRQAIASATSRRVRAPRRLRTPAERIAEAHAGEPAADSSQPPATLDSALASLQRSVAQREAGLAARRDADLADAGLSDAHMAGAA
jgi:hypothetical protein